jgi:hypothetical protein
MRRPDLATTKQDKRLSRPGRHGAFGPAIALAAAVTIALAGSAIATAALPKDAVLPFVVLMLYVLAAAVALIASHLGRPSERGILSYWDVAGAITVFGICASTMVDPDQLVRIMASQQAEQ